MTMNELLVRTLEDSLGMLKSTLEDFSDADLLARPLDNANHPNWQLGHLLKSETGLLTSIGAKMPALPTEFNAVYNEDSALSKDTSQFWKKEQLLAMFEKTRAATVAFTKSLKAEDFGRATPGELAQWLPTVGEVIAMQTTHMAMHLGQFQVARRKFGKKILF